MKQDLLFTAKADRMLLKLIRADKSLELKFNDIFTKLIKDQFTPSLYTHKVYSKKYGKAFSSRATKDLRIIWNYTEENTYIIIYTIGPHSGKRAVY